MINENINESNENFQFIIEIYYPKKWPLRTIRTCYLIWGIQYNILKILVVSPNTRKFN